MSDASFQRPGSTPVGAHVDHPPAPNRLSWAPSVDSAPPVIVLDDTPSTDGPPGEASPNPPRWNRTATLLTGAALGVAATLVVGALASPSPLDLTPESFPDEVLGAALMDDPSRAPRVAGEDVDVEAEFAEQLRYFRFAHGVDGATRYYTSPTSDGVLALSIANGRLPLLQPANVDGDPNGQYVVTITHDSGGIQCVSQLVGNSFEIDPSTGQPVEDGTDQDAPPRWGATTCVLRDDRRHIDIRLDPLFSVADPDTMTPLYVDELRRIHALFTG